MSMPAVDMEASLDPVNNPANATLTGPLAQGGRSCDHNFSIFRKLPPEVTKMSPPATENPAPELEVTPVEPEVKALEGAAPAAIKSPEKTVNDNVDDEVAKTPNGEDTEEEPKKRPSPNVDENEGPSKKVAVESDHEEEKPAPEEEATPATPEKVED